MRRVALLLMVVTVVGLSTSALVWGGDADSKGAKANSGRAIDAAKRGYWQEAMALWEDALELAPDDAEILNNYAVALEAIGSYEEAGRIYEKALTIKPDSRRIRRNLMLNKDFYVSYVLREDPKESDGPTDGDGQTPPPGDPQGEESPPPEKEQNKDGEGGGDDDQI